LESLLARGRDISLIVKYAEIAAAIAQEISMTVQTASNNSSDVSALQKTVEKLRTIAESREKLFLIFTAIAIVFGVLAFVADNLARGGFKRVTEAQDELAAAKDRELATQLADKETKIAGLDADAKKFEASAKRDIATVKGEAATANEKAAGANKAAESERLQRVKLEAQVAPRRMTAAQQQTLTDACRPLGGRRVTVISYSLDVEAAVLATQLIPALEAAGIKVRPNLLSFMPFGGVTTGIQVSGADAAFSSALTRCIAAGGLAMAPPAPAQVTTDADAEAVILVGVKPITQ